MILGQFAGGHSVRTDYNQTDPNKANYLVGRENIANHLANKSNPHGVTKSQVGLGNVPNVATNDQTPTYSAASTLATLTSGEKLSVSMGKIMKAISDLISHIGNKSNPHGVTKSQVGLGSVDNTSDSSKPVSAAQATAIADAKSAGTTAQSNLNSHTSNKSNPHGVTAAQAGAVPTSRTVNGKALSSNITLGASDVGAAPAGYGLGEKVAASTADINLVTPARFFRTVTANGTSENGPAFPQAARNVGIAIPYATDEVAQLLIRTLNGGVRIRRLYNGVWTEEWVNPPLAEGTEYQTVERLGSKPVYAKYVSFGTLPASGSSYVPTGISGGTLVSLTGTFFDGSGNAEAYPIMNGSGPKCLAWVSAGCSNLYTQAIVDCSAHTGEFIIKYTKG